MAKIEMIEGSQVRVPPALERKHGGMARPVDGVYDASCLSTFEECPRKYYYQYEVGIELPGEPIGRLFGYAWHEVLRVWYETHDLDAAIAEFNVLPAETGDPARNREKGASRMKAYVKKYASEPFTVRDIEVELLLDMGRGRAYSGRLDMVVTLEGNIYPLDHKTSRSVGASFMDGFRPHLQFDGYTYACGELVAPCTGLIVNAISTAANPREPFGRATTSRSPGELAAFPVCFHADVDAIERCRSEGVWPQHRSQCHAYYTTCEYARLCVWGDRDRMREEYVSRDSQEEEESEGEVQVHDNGPG